MISDYGTAFDQSGPDGSLNSQLRVRLSMDLIKTADELWQDIQQGQSSLDRKASLGEMTLVEFLLIAAAVVESSAGKINLGFINGMIDPT